MYRVCPFLLKAIVSECPRIDDGIDETERHIDTEGRTQKRNRRTYALEAIFLCRLVDGEDR